MTPYVIFVKYYMAEYYIVETEKDTNQFHGKRVRVSSLNIRNYYVRRKY